MIAIDTNILVYAHREEFPFFPIADARLTAKRDLKDLEGQLATRADLIRIDGHLLELKRDFKENDLSVKRDIKELELRMAAEIAPLKWGMAVYVGGIIALILKTFFPH